MGRPPEIGRVGVVSGGGRGGSVHVDHSGQDWMRQVVVSEVLCGGKVT